MRDISGMRFVIFSWVLLALHIEVASGFISVQRAAPVFSAVPSSQPRILGRAAARWSTCSPRPERRLAPLYMSSPPQEEGDDLPPLQTLIEADPKEGAMLAYMGAVTVGLFALGVATYKLGGQLLGLGFADGRFEYWDGAPTYALLLVYPPLYFLFPETRGLLIKTLVVSFLVTLPIYYLPYTAINWEPTTEHVFAMVSVPVLSYVSYFMIRASKVYREIAEEERMARQEEQDGQDS